MTKLRNIGYLRFGSKIRQGFAGGITSLTPPLSPLSRSHGHKMRARGKGQSFIFGAGACRPPAGQLPALTPRHLAAGGLPPGRGRQAPAPNIKLRPFPLRSHFLPTRSREGRERVSEVIPPAKPCRILDPNRR